MVTQYIFIICVYFQLFPSLRHFYNISCISWGIFSSSSAYCFVNNYLLCHFIQFLSWRKNSTVEIIWVFGTRQGYISIMSALHMLCNTGLRFFSTRKNVAYRESSKQDAFPPDTLVCFSFPTVQVLLLPPWRKS